MDAGRTLSLDDVRAAAQRIAGRVERTPLRFSRTLSTITGADVWVKFENQQFTASFKERGALNKLLQLSDDERRRGVIAASAGNHAQGLAYHGQQLGVPVTIVMPRATPTTKVEHTRAFGAEVVLEGEVYDDADAHARELCAARGLVFVHPFDDWDVMAGQGTIALEMLEDQPDLEILPVPIGGGGLIAGVATAARGAEERHRGDRGGGGDVPLLHRAHEEPALQDRRPDHRRRHRGEGGGRPHLRHGAPADRRRGAGRGAVSGTGRRALRQRGEDRGRGAGAASLGRAPGASRTLPRAQVRPDPLRRQHRHAPPRQRADARAGARAADGEPAHHRRGQPGLLATVSATLGANGANIIEVTHNRLALDVPAKGAEFDLVVETRDSAHTDEIIELLRQQGYPPREL